MPVYDAKQFDPPAPLAKVVVQTRDHTKAVANVPMLIDSGADVTLIPQRCADQLGLHAEPDEGVVLRAYDGTGSTARVVDGEVLFLGRIFRGRFPVIDDECGTLGRNVLNHLSLVLDGPRQNWREETQ